jgi:hypothetical protein
MRRWPPSVVLLVGVALALSACGGGKTTYALAKTTQCLKTKPGLTVRTKVDFVASTALGGAVSILMKGNEVTISFGLDEAEAQRLDQAYRRFRGRNIGIDDVLRPKGNAVLLWEAHPTDQQLSTTDGCLK